MSETPNTQRPPLSAEEIDRLEQQAKEATPGPWSTEHNDDAVDYVVRQTVAIPDWIVAPDDGICSDPGLQAAQQRRVNNRFIAAANPDTVLRLLAMLREAQHSLAECYRLSGADPDGNEDWRLARHAVEEVRRLRADHDAYEARESSLRESMKAAPVTEARDE